MTKMNYIPLSTRLKCKECGWPASFFTTFVFGKNRDGEDESDSIDHQNGLTAKAFSQVEAIDSFYYCAECADALGAVNLASAHMADLKSMVHELDSQWILSEERHGQR